MAYREEPSPSPIRRASFKTPSRHNTFERRPTFVDDENAEIINEPRGIQPNNDAAYQGTTRHGYPISPRMHRGNPSGAPRSQPPYPVVFIERSRSGRVADRQRPRRSSSSSSSSVSDHRIDIWSGDDDEDNDDYLDKNFFDYKPFKGLPPSKRGTPVAAVPKDGSQPEPIAPKTANEIQNRNAPSTPVSGILHVLESRYTGDHLLDGSHSAEITFMQETRRQRQSIFRWFHVQQEKQSLDDLSVQLADIPDMDGVDRRGLTRLLAQVKRRRVKRRRTPGGKNALHMDPGVIRVSVPTDNGDAKSLLWLCLPYLSLEKYSGLLEAGREGTFPVETLLQSDFSLTTQEREMKQIVSQQYNRKGDQKCFHIAQLWFIVLDNSLLITCGRMPVHALGGGEISFYHEPPNQLSDGDKTIYVSYGSALWGFPLESCISWFDFVQKFHHFWPNNIQFYHREALITKDTWPEIINNMKQAKIRVTLNLRVERPHRQFIAHGVLPSTQIPTTEERQQGSTHMQSSPDDVNDTFHVFSWLTTRETDSKSQKYDLEMLKGQLQDIDNYLLHSTEMREQLPYRRCGRSSRHSVTNYLMEERRRLEDTDDSESKEINEYGVRVNLFNAADLINKFFYPPYSNGETETERKFWGAVERIIKTSFLDDEESPNTRGRARGSRRIYNNTANTRLDSIYKCISKLAAKVLELQRLVNHVPETMQHKVDIPHDLVLCWLHSTMALVHGAEDVTHCEEHSDIAYRLISRGTTKVVESIASLDKDSLLDHLVIQPMALVSLISLKLFNNSLGESLSLSDIYYNYIRELEHNITLAPERSHQTRINLLKEELKVIKRVTESQRRFMSDLGRGILKSPTKMRNEHQVSSQFREVTRTRDRRNYYGVPQDRYYTDRTIILDDDSLGIQDPDEFAKLPPTDPGGFANLFLGDGQNWLERRKDELREVEIEARRLEMLNTHEIDTTKDRQEAAVYAFTMVTIIFLPLGTISSIFGMNTSDIANLESGQWLYWAVALPITALVIVAGLAWMGELSNLGQWLLRRPKNSGGRMSINSPDPGDLYRRRYQPLPPPPPPVTEFGGGYMSDNPFSPPN
ncbi:uncharacterized protein F4807DRAFT_152454 [Annulohypoxylon truncatum]|uniref:uncharacterized protein n=1 Tax=Annulohypoxylon truncatum TaxID=327061 RepID=UPI002007D2EC|nr:uncharacterized protein F4807DRAFT_152454 [Annulohypoxylon truncatum]KAI1208460.1 hypothetical protein F4807DRAFT_152454 [Annulohypoxylon truncatum]